MSPYKNTISRKQRFYLNVKKSIKLPTPYELEKPTDMSEEFQNSHSARAESNNSVTMRIKQLELSDSSRNTTPTKRQPFKGLCTVKLKNIKEAAKSVPKLKPLAALRGRKILDRTISLKKIENEMMSLEMKIEQYRSN